MKATRFLIALLLLATVVGTADAQYKRLSWDGCDPQIPDKSYDPMLSAQSYNLVVSAVGLTHEMIGHDSMISIGPALPDAWRFDDEGCQTSSGLLYSYAGLAKVGCPALTGNAPLPITAFLYDPETRYAAMRLAVVYDMLTPDPAMRYCLWVLTFDHQYSVIGAGAPPNTCGNVDQGLLFDLTTDILLQTGGVLKPATQPGDVQVTWNGGPFVPTVPATWGKVKGLYR
jgi:hypothetical protein